MPLSLWLRSIIGGILVIIIFLYFRQWRREEEENRLWMREVILNDYLQGKHISLPGFRLGEINSDLGVSGVMDELENINKRRHQLLGGYSSRHFLILGLLLLLILLLSWLLF